ncbi:retroviral-like aspartic protease family protein [Massilia sp. CMS3.1]|uniref:retroviral-like aspartic protease family protein n=1 Tax=Massilia sp. CMS3.1 TaxID=3373083 RepID=UPI003EE74FC5
MPPTLSHAVVALAICGFLLPATVRATPQTGTDAPTCHYLQVAKLPLQYTGPGLELTTQGRMHGSPATMLVDTGAFDTLLTRTGTERRNLMLRGTGGYAQGIGGYATIYQTQIKELSVGPAKIGRSWLPVLADFGVPPPYDAIIGAPFLLQADMELSLATKELRFFRPHKCGDSFLAYWDPAAMEIPFETSPDRSPNPRFTVLVNGKKMRAMIDTGATTTVIGLKAAQRAGLKLDAPGVTRLSDAVGIGTNRVPRWSTTFDTFQVADETVRNAEVGVIDWDDHVDIVLGADFLRAHRVLFAMSQRKIYLSYIGGEPFGQRRKLEPWIQQEADAGNADAQFVLAGMYTRGGVIPKDAALSASWLEKSARGGNGQANLMVGRSLMLQGFPEEAATRLRSALDKLPSHRAAALWLYLARVRSKQLALAKSELAASFAQNADNAWPGPVADFYLGKITAEALLKQAARDRTLAQKNTCQALSAMAEWHGAHGERERAAALGAQIKAECLAQPAGAATAAQASH